MTLILWLVGSLLIVSFGLIVVRGAPYVPTHRRQIEVAFDELYPLKKTDTVVDLGSGDGIVLLAAVTRGASAVGYELNPILLLISRFRLRKRINHASVVNKDFLRLQTLPPETTVVYAFTTGHNIEAIGRKMQQWSQQKPLHFISYGFALKDIAPLRSSGPMHLYLFSSSKA